MGRFHGGGVSGRSRPRPRLSWSMPSGPDRIRGLWSLNLWLSLTGNSPFQTAIKAHMSRVRVVGPGHCFPPIRVIRSTFSARSTSMTEPNSPNHWDLLASNLGATPPPKRSSNHPLPRRAQQPFPGTPARASRPERTAGAPSRSADLDLAASFWSTPAPSAPPPPPVASTPAPPVKDEAWLRQRPRHRLRWQRAQARAHGPPAGSAGKITPISSTSRSISRNPTTCWNRRKPPRFRPSRPRKPPSQEASVPVGGVAETRRRR